MPNTIAKITVNFPMHSINSKEFYNLVREVNSLIYLKTGVVNTTDGEYIETTDGEEIKVW